MDPTFSNCLFTSLRCFFSEFLGRENSSLGLTELGGAPSIRHHSSHGFLASRNTPHFYHCLGVGDSPVWDNTLSTFANAFQRFRCMFFAIKSVVFPGMIHSKKVVIFT